MPEHCAGNAVGYRRDKMSARAAGTQRFPCVSEDSLAAYILPVDRGSHAAHENELSFKVALQGRNIVFRQSTLPDLNADLGHIVNYRHKIRVGMVHGNAAARADIAVKAAVRLLEKLAPHIRLHEQRILRTPVVVREDNVRLQIVDEHFHIAKTILCYILDKLVHLIRVLIEVGERRLKTHKKMALLEYARAHKSGDELLITCRLARFSAALIPAFRAGALDIRCVHRFTPARYIPAHCHIAVVKRHRARRILREAYRRSPAVNADCAALAVAAQICVYGVIQAHMQRLVLLELTLGLSVGLEHFKKDLFCSLHNIHSSEYRRHEV